MPWELLLWTLLCFEFKYWGMSLSYASQLCKMSTWHPQPPNLQNWANLYPKMVLEGSFDDVDRTQGGFFFFCHIGNHVIEFCRQGSNSKTLTFTLLTSFLLTPLSILILLLDFILSLIWITVSKILMKWPPTWQKPLRLGIELTLYVWGIIVQEVQWTYCELCIWVGLDSCLKSINRLEQLICKTS